MGSVPFFPLSPDFQHLSATWAKPGLQHIPQRANRFISTIILHMHKLVVLYVCVALLAGCSSAPYKAHKDTSTSVSGVRIDLSDEHQVKQILDQ